MAGDYCVVNVRCCVHGWPTNMRELRQKVDEIRYFESDVRIRTWEPVAGWDA